MASPAGIEPAVSDRKSDVLATTLQGQKKLAELRELAPHPARRRNHSLSRRCRLACPVENSWENGDRGRTCTRNFSILSRVPLLIGPRGRDDYLLGGSSGRGRTDKISFTRGVHFFLCHGGFLDENGATSRYCPGFAGVASLHLTFGPMSRGRGWRYFSPASSL